MDKLTGAVSEKFKSHRYKPHVSIDVGVDTMSAAVPSGDSDWRKEEMKRCAAEVKALEKELEGFDHQKAGETVKKAMEIKLKLKKLRLEEHKLKLNGGGPSY